MLIFESSIFPGKKRDRIQILKIELGALQVVTPTPGFASNRGICTKKMEKVTLMTESVCITTPNLRSTKASEHENDDDDSSHGVRCFLSGVSLCIA